MDSVSTSNLFLLLCTIVTKHFPVSALYGDSIIFIILGITQTDNFFVVVALLTLSMAANSAVYNGLFSNHADLSPNYVGILMGLSNSFGNLSAVLAPLYVGLIVTDKVRKILIK